MTTVTSRNKGTLFIAGGGGAATGQGAGGNGGMNQSLIAGNTGGNGHAGGGGCQGGSAENYFSTPYPGNITVEYQNSTWGALAQCIPTLTLYIIYEDGHTESRSCTVSDIDKFCLLCAVLQFS